MEIKQVKLAFKGQYTEILPATGGGDFSAQSLQYQHVGHVLKAAFKGQIH